MKTTTILMLLVVCFAAGPALADGNKLPLDKRIAEEKLLLTETYQAGMANCRQHKRRAIKNSCLERQKALLTSSFDELEHNPKAYFRNKEKDGQDEKALGEARKLISSGKGK